MPSITSQQTAAQAAYAEAEANLAEWAESEAYSLMSNIVWSESGHLVSARIQWRRDLSYGTYTTLSTNSNGGMVDSYQITHDASGLRVFQPKVARNSDGQIVQKPKLKVL